MKQLFYIAILTVLVIFAIDKQRPESLLDSALSQMEHESIYDTTNLRREAYRAIGCQHTDRARIRALCLRHYATKHDLPQKEAARQAFIAGAKAIGDIWATTGKKSRSSTTSLMQTRGDAIIWKFEYFDLDLADDIATLAQNKPTKIVVLDLYHNHGGYNAVATKVTKTFVAAGLVSHQKEKSGREIKAYAENNSYWTQDPRVQLRVLISAETVSNGEYVPRVLKSLRPNVCILGSASWGKGVTQGMGKLAYFTNGWNLLPDGSTFDGTPLKPDIETTTHDEALALALSPTACAL